MNCTRALALLLAASGLVAPPAGADAPRGTLPEAYTAYYDLVKGPLTIGHAQRSLGPLGDGRYFFESVTKPTGIAKLFTKGEVTERSEFIYHNGTLRPLHYRYNNTGRKNSARDEVEFDWARGIANNRMEGDAWSVALAPGVLDKFLYQLAIMADLAQGKTELAYAIADNGLIKSYTAQVLTAEPIDTPAGRFQTIRVERDDGKRRTTLWCAPDLRYLPIQIGYRERDGSYFEARLTQLNGIARVPTADTRPAPAAPKTNNLPPGPPPPVW